MQCYYWLLVVTLLHTAAGQLDPVEQDSILDLARVLSPLPGNWSTTNASDACSSWQGITCSSNHVVYVVLYPGFSGVLPASIGNLSLLTTLDLRQNLIVGTIPPEIGKLQNLRTLYLHQNLLLGTIPKELGQLSNLQYCYLYGNVLSGTIPAEFSNCQNLLQLDLSGNKLDGTIPKAILSLPKCTTLSLLNNLLTGEIPSEVENLAQVTYLALSQNALSGTIPKTIGNLGKLTQLNLFSNSLTGSIPNEMSNLRALRYLYLNSNKLSGTIPNDIGKLSQLNYLYMHDNNLEGTLPESIGNLTNIQYFYVSTNRLSGTIPSSLGNLTNLISLYFYDNQFTGTIPDISRLSRLQALHLRTNFLTGTIPAYFGNFTLLSQLHLHYNGLSGTIPSELGNLQYLTDLYLYNNPLTGTIPESLGQLSRLKSLYLSVSQLNGTVPASFANLTSLTTLYLGSTNLHGCFDANMTALTLCDVSYTWLECFPSVCTYIPPPVAVPVDQIGGNTPQDQTEIIRLAVGISVPIGAALIAGIIVLIVLLARRAKKKKQEEIMLRDPNRKPLSDVLPARMIINYSDLKIVRELGAGDFGKVFEGRWQNAQVAVKINTDGDWASFYNEAELMLNLRPHPNVVQTLGYCDHGGKLIVVLEYCNGGSLDNRLFDDDTTVDNADKLELMYNIASGISHLHANKIIHRDLAARNILLSHGIAKVADFGLSRRVEEINRHSQTKSVLGPIRWMAPESLANAFYNEKTDVWSFGIVCAEILNRCEPHLNEDPLTVAAKIRDDFVTPPINGDCDPQLVRLLKDCWNPDPQKRPDMKTICSRLEELLQVK